jgi:flavin-dependent dehydrogenase
MNRKAIKIIGAGPSGLAAAITLANKGIAAVVYEAKSEVGCRFGRDLQGLENWSSETDVLDEFKALNMPLDFEYNASNFGKAYDSFGNQYPVYTKKPLFYTIERGPNAASLDSALLRKAISMGVEVKFNHKKKTVESKAILATGPKRADAIAAGFQFDTTMENGFWVICNDQLAPKGYAYLLIMNGRGTVKTCFFQDFKHQNLYVNRTLKAFEKLVNLTMINPIKHGGAGNLFFAKSLLSGANPVVGEQAGFQDALWGFGLRYAIRSGVMAANNIQQPMKYQNLSQRELIPLQKTAIVNRCIYSLLGNYGYRFVLKRGTSQDIHKLLNRMCKSSKRKNIFYPLAKLCLGWKELSKSCHQTDCRCVWCKSKKIST